MPTEADGVLGGSISVIVPAYNAERYVAEALSSIFNQSLPASEVIVVDDGSIDGTAAVVQGFGERIRYVRQENAGCAEARNRGLALAKGEFVAFLDADDVYHPRKLELQWKQFDARPELELSVCLVRDFWSPELPPGPRGDTRFTPQLRPGQVSTWLVRRSVFAKSGKFLVDAGVSHAEGSELYLRIKDAGAVIEELPQLLVERRLHGANMVAQRESHLASIATLLKRRIDRKRAKS